MSSEYQKLREKHRELDKRSRAGDRTARADKAKVGNEIRAIEREAARGGTVLTAISQGDKVIVEQADAPTKRSLQEEYTRKFDPQLTVMLPDPTQAGLMKTREEKEQSLREYHQKRLSGKR